MTVTRSVDPAVWGPGGWHILHRLSMHIRRAEEGKELYMTLPRILPCPKCQASIAHHMSKILPFPSNRRDIPFWVCKLHNMVNAALRKDIAELTVKEIQERFKTPDASEWVFVYSMVEAHPGKPRASPEYLDALKVFMRHWTQSRELPMPSDAELVSKTKMKQWLDRNNKGARVQIRSCANSDACDI